MKFKKLLVLSKNIFNYNFLRHFKPLKPTALQINITYRCHAKCQMCHIWKMKPKNELSFAEWKKIIQDPIFSTIEKLSIAGGEPLLHPNLIKLTRLFINSMPKLQSISLVTNGLLPDLTVSRVRDLINLCGEKDINFWVSVSLDGTGQTHQLMRGVPKAFEKTSKTILGLKSLQSKYDLGLGVGCVICHKNLHKLKELEKWCQKHKIPLNFQLVGFHKTYVQNLEKQSELDFKEKDKKSLYKLLKKLASKRSIKNIMSYYWHDMLWMYKEKGRRTTPCPFLLDALVIDSLGDVYYCLSEKKIGNCRKGKTVSEIYYDSHNLRLRQQRARTVCLKCNSACFVHEGLKKDFKKFIWFYLTGKHGSVGL